MEEELQAKKDLATTTASPYQTRSNSKTILGKRTALPLQRDPIQKVNNTKKFWTKVSDQVVEKWSLHTNGKRKRISVNALDPSSKKFVKGSWYTAKVYQLEKTCKKKDFLFKTPLWEEMKQKDELLTAIRGKPKKVKRDLSERYSEKPPPEKGQKIRIYPNKEQKKILLKWFGAARKTYNLCLDKFNQLHKPYDPKPLHLEFVNNDSLIEKGLKYLTETPSDVREHALKDLSNNFRSNFARHAGSGKHFKIKFRRRKQKQQSIYICHRTVNRYQVASDEGQKEAAKDENPNEETQRKTTKKKVKEIDAKDIVRDKGQKEAAKDENPNEETQRKTTKKKVKEIDAKDIVRDKGQKEAAKDKKLKPSMFDFILDIRTSLPVEFNYDFRILLNSRGHYYFCISQPTEKKSENQAPLCRGNSGVIALDPGVRKFITGFQASGKVMMAGVHDVYRLAWHCERYDKLQSKWSSKGVNHKQRYRLRKAGKRILAKVRNRVDDLHKKLCKWLLENHRVILIPKLETKRLVAKETIYASNNNDDEEFYWKIVKRNISSRTAKNMLNWAHYRFRKRLILKSKEYPWCCVKLVDERDTSRICGKCGRINKKLGSSETFKCPFPNCQFKIDRDINAARNILIKYLTAMENNDINRLLAYGP